MEKEILNVSVGVGDGNCRLDLYLAKKIPEFSRSKIKKLISLGLVNVDGICIKKPSFLLNKEHLISILKPPLVETAKLDNKLSCNIFYEDEYLIVIDKPAGCIVHQGAGKPEVTIVDMILEHCGRLSSVGADLGRPGVVHRLDRDTSGLMIMAKDDQVHYELQRGLKNKEISRKYLALLDGYLPSNDFLYSSYLVRDPNNRLKFLSYEKEVGGSRFAKSHYEVIKIYAHRVSLVNVSLYTGRTHQIRVHSKALGVPIIGDMRYHRVCELPTLFPSELRSEVKLLKRQFLHSSALLFKHPITKETIHLKSDLPEDLGKILRSFEEFVACD